MLLPVTFRFACNAMTTKRRISAIKITPQIKLSQYGSCLLYTSDAADE